MIHNSLFKILLASLFLYIAWPQMNHSLISSEKIFWASWIGLFLLVVGSNFSTLLKITSPPILERDIKQRERTRYR